MRAKQACITSATISAELLIPTSVNLRLNVLFIYAKIVHLEYSYIWSQQVPTGWQQKHRS